MQSPGRLTLSADRQTPMVRTLEFQGLDFTGAVFAMQVRDRKDGGTVRANLSTVTLANAEGVRLVYADTDTITNHIAAGRMEEVPDGYVAADNLALSLVALRINEATMEAMPFGTEIGDDLDLWWDLQITPSGGVKEVYLAGPFVTRAGVTQ